MNLTKDEKYLIERYRNAKKDCEQFQYNGWSIPACTFRAGKGIYSCILKGEFIKED
jgi:hypothetical protein